MRVENTCCACAYALGRCVRVASFACVPASQSPCIDAYTRVSEWVSKHAFPTVSRRSFRSPSVTPHIMTCLHTHSLSHTRTHTNTHKHKHTHISPPPTLQSTRAWTRALSAHSTSSRMDRRLRATTPRYRLRAALPPSPFPFSHSLPSFFLVYPPLLRVIFASPSPHCMAFPFPYVCTRLCATPFLLQAYHQPHTTTLAPRTQE